MWNLTQGTSLDIVDPFIHLGSTLSCDGSFDSKINLGIERARKSISNLKIGRCIIAQSLAKQTLVFMIFAF